MVTRRLHRVFIILLVVFFCVTSFKIALRHRRAVGRPYVATKMAVIEELFDEESENIDSDITPKTHGYEGDFRVGNIVKVKGDIRIWSVKKYMDQGFNCKGFEGKVVELVLYGRKYKSLCSSITPIKVEFQPDSNGVPSGMLDRKFVAHFSAEELELISEK